MRNGEWRPDDLDLIGVVGAAVVTLIVVALDLPLALRLPLGLVMTLILPGYAASMALFPPGELRAVERAALAFSLSLAMIVVGAPLLDALPVGIAPAPLIAWVAASTLVATGAAWWRRQRARAAAKPAPDGAVPGPRRDQTTRRQLLVGGLGILAISAVVMLANSFAPQPSRATEFFIVSPNAPASLPTEVTVGVPTSIGLGIANRETGPRQFRVVVRLGSTELVAAGPISVAPGETWLGSAQVAFPVATDDQVIRFLLYEGESAEAFRSLSLQLDVVAP